MTVSRLEIAETSDVASDSDVASAGTATDTAARAVSPSLAQLCRDDAAWNAFVGASAICGDEPAQGQLQLRDLEAGTQRPTARANLARELARTGNSHRHG